MQVHLAWLWCTFLTIENLWWWQRSAENETTFNIEYRWVSQLTFQTSTIPHLVGDTFDVIVDVCGSNANETYDCLCELAWKFDQGIFKYATYLHEVTAVYRELGLECCDRWP